MSYKVRNHPTALGEPMRQLQEDLHHTSPAEESANYDVVGIGRFTDKSDSNDKVPKYTSDDNGTVSVEQKDEAAYMANPNQPVVTYSTREPNYPTGYSCQHILLFPNHYPTKGRDDAVESSTALLSNSEDEDASKSSVLQETPVRLSLEFEIPAAEGNDYDEVIDNVEALQWSLLNEIAARSGLSKGCKIQYQYDERTLVSALTNMNNLQHSPAATLSNESNDTYDDISSNNNSNRLRKNRRRTRDIQADRSLISTLPYPTSLYSIESTRPKWTASCSSQTVNNEDATSQCFTTEINFNAKYRGTSGESNLIEDYIESIVHNQIALDAKQLFAEDITGLRWVSNDDAAAVFNPPEPEEGTLTPIYFGPDNSLPDQQTDAPRIDDATLPPEETPNDLLAIIGLPLATAVILCGIWYFTHMYYVQRRKNRKSSKGSKQISPLGMTVSGQKDIESGSVSTGGTPELISKSSSDTQDSQENQLNVTNVTVAETVELSTVASASVQAKSPPKRRPKSCPVSVDSPERSAAGLPPRPTMPKRGVSKLLKKQRKKKKRKKKQVLALTRVNSRDNIQEMPIISESESECDSEYTSGDEEYCDDGSSYDASVGCLTPSGSRAGSISGSPQKSPREEVVSGNSQDYQFVMEAPELSKDTFREKEAVPNLSLRPRTHSEADEPKPAPAEQSNSGNDRRVLEIDTHSDCDSSFDKESGSVMERMMPLPWLK